MNSTSNDSAHHSPGGFPSIDFGEILKGLRQYDGLHHPAHEDFENPDLSSPSSTTTHQQHHQGTAGPCSNFSLVLTPHNVLMLLRNLTESLKNLTEHQHRYHHNVNGFGGHHGTNQGFKDSDENAVYYIIVVLLFYSFGIVFMMVKYMRKERQELEETRMYKEYVKAARDRCTQSKWVPTNRLALTALNTVNVISQPYDEERITFV